jgi:hypothetical protein
MFIERYRTKLIKLLKERYVSLLKELIASGRHRLL